MIQNNNVSNTKDDRLDDISPSDGIDDLTEPEENFSFKEPIVITTVIGLTLFNGISLYPWITDYEELPQWFLNSERQFSAAVSLIGSGIIAFLSNNAGRKQTYRFLCALSVFSFILRVSSKNSVMVYLTFININIINGGTSTVNSLIICEYSSPKYRFAWMMIDKVTTNTIDGVVARATDNSIVFFALLAIQSVLGIICLKCIVAWPESPYWLATKGKFEQSKEAFISLRGEEAKKELDSVLVAPLRPGLRKFWIAQLLALTMISIAVFTDLQKAVSIYVHGELLSYAGGNPQSDLISISPDYFTIDFFITMTIYIFLIAVSCSWKRKSLFIFVVIISSVLSYAEALGLYLVSIGHHDNILLYLLYNASDVIRTCGPALFADLLYVEIAPFACNITISFICAFYLFLGVLIEFAFLYILVFYATWYLPMLLIVLFTTLGLLSASVYYFYAPETKDMTLLEIQKSYTPEENDSNSEQNQNIVLNKI